MSSDTKTLDDLRREIDAIDDQLHDLIMQRTKIVEGVRTLKANERVKIRPAREAEILFRLMERHAGHFPRRELSRIWRELIVATLGFEGPFTVAVFAPDTYPGFWDVARDQYGSYTPMTRFDNAARVVETVRDGGATIGIVPMPARDDTLPWWRHLANRAAETPRVIARLPFAGRGNIRDLPTDALAIAAVTFEPTGRDITCLIVETGDSVSLDGFDARLRDRGLNPRHTRAWPDPTRPGLRLFFTEIFGFIADEQGTLKGLADAFEDGAVAFHAGGYATPLSDAELDGTDRP
jgi:chorismate mutase/prephenate dehydratase